MERRWLYMMAPWPALLVGGATIRHLREGFEPLLIQYGAAVAGSVALILLGRRRQGPTPVGFLPMWSAWATVVVIATTLAFGGLEGVHRWIRLGPLQVNASMLLAPVVITVAGLLMTSRRVAAASALFVALQIVHLLQPDAAQAAAVAVAAVIMAARRRETTFRGAAVVTALLAGGAFVRRDPLGRVASVEGIVQEAFAWSPIVGAVAASAAVCLIVPFLLHARSATDDDERSTAIALGLYVGTLFVASQIGEFPVPVLGYGVATVLSYYTAAGAALWRVRGVP